MNDEYSPVIPDAVITPKLFKIAAIAVLVGLCLYAMFGSYISDEVVSRTGADLVALQTAKPVTEAPAILIAVIGFAIGCYGTIVGIGGGPLIIPFLVFFYGWENEFLVATSLFIVFLNAFSGCVGYAQQKRIDYKGAVKFALAALPGAVLSGFVHHFVNVQSFNVIFGIFLILLAVYTLTSIKKIDAVDTDKKPAGYGKKNGWRQFKITDAFGYRFNFYSNDMLGIKINLILGFFCGFLGVGGGVFQVPILIFLLKYPTHLATATSQMVTMLTCLFALIPHIFLGNVCYAEAAWMGVGVVLGAQAGARLAAKLDSKITMYLFVIILLAFAIKLFFV
jgi:hypothetical protein